LFHEAIPHHRGDCRRGSIRRRLSLVAAGPAQARHAGTVTVHTYYSVKLKSGKTEYDYAGDHDVNCANSLFPQLGLKPCWYAIRHTDEQITIDSGNPNNPHLF
jgi:hypothetical protein